MIAADTVTRVPAIAHTTLRVEREGLWWSVSAPGVPPLRGLPSKSIGEFRVAIDEEVAEHDAAIANQKVAEWWAGLQAAFAKAWSDRTWIDEEMIGGWDNVRSRALVPLSSAATTALMRMVDARAWDAIGSPTSVRNWAAHQNSQLVDVQLREERDFFDSIEKTPLTDEQARAVVCFDNRVLLVASAGSGKTSTIVAKAGWTVRRGIARPEEILLLAFNSAAAKEMAERLASRFADVGLDPGGVQAQTFHAFGLRVLGEASGKKPRLGAELDVDNGLRVLKRVVDGLKAGSDEFAIKWWLMQNVLGIPLEDEE